MEHSPPDDDDFDAAASALFSPVHQATTKDAISAAAVRRKRTVREMRWYIDKLGIPRHGRIIHVTGTKGKGSTACFCESLARLKYGKKTGLFTSPHLRDVRERIRLNGRPVSKSSFGKAYWRVRRRLEETEEGENDDQDLPPEIPGYFRMLTLVAFQLFLVDDPVEVLVLEVGMGGRYDATNVFDLDPNTSSCGVTLLDYDHVRILGNTLSKIAWEKGGIMAMDKENENHVSPYPSEDSESVSKGILGDSYSNGIEDKRESGSLDATRSMFFCLGSNPPDVVRMLRSCAKVEGRGRNLTVVGKKQVESLRQSMEHYNLKLGLGNVPHQYENAALAVALVSSTMGESGSNDSESREICDALSAASWPGRCQMIQQDRVSWHLDGAHTVQSLAATVNWWNQSSKAPNRVLVFNCSHERDPTELMELLINRSSRSFDAIYFCAADSHRPSPVSPPTAAEMLSSRGKSPAQNLSEKCSWQETLCFVWQHLDESSERPELGCFENVRPAVQNIRERSLGNRVDVLVTGSLYLVGSILDAIGWDEEE